MKPHIFLEVPATYPRMWVCLGTDKKFYLRRGTGRTPLEAYDEWLIRSLMS